jgi:hypothetical protein
MKFEQQGTERRNCISNTATHTIYCALIYTIADTSNSFGLSYQQQCPTGESNLGRTKPYQIVSIL